MRIRTLRMCRRDACTTSLLLLALMACGGESAPTPRGESATLSGTLAYVAAKCRQNAAGLFVHETLLVRQGERDPITVMETPDVGPAPGLPGLCRFVGSNRGGAAFAASGLGLFQHLAV